MKYFKAFKIDVAPFIQWDLWAHSKQEIDAMGELSNPLILAEEDIPTLEHNACPLKIVDGSLESRTSEEMDAIRVSDKIKQGLNSQKSKINVVNSSSFTYNDYEFPMDESSRLYYQKIDKSPAHDYRVLTTQNDIYTLTANEHVADFIKEYYNKLEEILKPD
jgi:hypothetical protein